VVVTLHDAESMIPVVRRPMFRLLGRAFPGVDAERVWHRLDLHQPREGEQLIEARIDRELLAPWRRALAWASVALLVAGVVFIYGVAPRLTLGPAAHVLLALGCGVLVHGLFILLVHEATHGNVFGGRADRWLGNAVMGALLLPFMAESYQAQHLVHHQRTNREGDTNWTPLRQRIWRRSRLLYALYELVPVLNNLDRLRERWPKERAQVLLSWAVAALTVVALRPGLVWWLLVVVGLNTINTLRLWAEHYGAWRGRPSNTYWCPLGFGIGNHEVHHRKASVSAAALWLGLWFREKDGSVFTSPLRVFAKGHGHFRAFQPDFTGDNV